MISRVDPVAGPGARACRAAVTPEALLARGHVPGGTQRRRRQCGVTLVELLVGLVILGLILSLAVPHGPLRSRSMESQATVERLVETLRRTRGMAIAENRSAVFVADTSPPRWRVGNGPWSPMPAFLSLDVITGADQIARGHTSDIRFHPDGSSSGGRLELAYPGWHVRIDVDWLTGQVSVANAE